MSLLRSLFFGVNTTLLAGAVVGTPGYMLLWGSHVVPACCSMTLLAFPALLMWTLEWRLFRQRDPMAEEVLGLIIFLAGCMGVFCLLIFGLGGAMKSLNTLDLRIGIGLSGASAYLLWCGIFRLWGRTTKSPPTPRGFAVEIIETKRDVQTGTSTNSTHPDV